MPTFYKRDKNGKMVYAKRYCQARCPDPFFVDETAARGATIRRRVAIACICKFSLFSQYRFFDITVFIFQALHTLLVVPLVCFGISIAPRLSQRLPSEMTQNSDGVLPRQSQAMYCPRLIQVLPNITCKTLGRKNLAIQQTSN